MWWSCRAEDGGDVRVVEAGEDLGLPREPGEPIRICRERVGEDLQGDLAVKLGVGGLPDLAHAAHVVVPEAGADVQGHGCQGRTSGSYRRQDAAGRRRSAQAPSTQLEAAMAMITTPPSPVRRPPYGLRGCPRSDERHRGHSSPACPLSRPALIGRSATRDPQFTEKQAAGASGAYGVAPHIIAEGT